MIFFILAASYLSHVFGPERAVVTALQCRLQREVMLKIRMGGTATPCSFLRALMAEARLCQLGVRTKVERLGGVGQGDAQRVLEKEFRESLRTLRKSRPSRYLTLPIQGL
jgi:hypothetical protein